MMLNTPSGPDTTRMEKVPASVTVGELVGDPRGQNLPAGHAVHAVEPLAPKVVAGHTLLSKAETPEKVIESSLEKTTVRTFEEEVRVAGMALPEAFSSMGEVGEGPFRTEKKS